MVTHTKETKLVEKQIRLIQRNLTSSKRRYYRSKFAKYAAEIEEERRMGKPGKVIKMLMQKTRSVFDLNLLELPSGDLELDLEKSQSIITNELSEWMSGDASQRQGINSQEADHTRAYNDETYCQSY